MMKTITTIFFAAVAVVCSAQLATASLIDLDFTAAAEGNERGYGFGDSIMVDGQEVTLFAWNTTEESLTNQSLDSDSFDPGGAVVVGQATNDGPFAYMDENEGGLGASQSLNKGLDSVPASEDQTGTAGELPGGREVVGIQLAGNAEVTRLTFRSSAHDPLEAGSLLDITFDNGNTWNKYSVGEGGVIDLSVAYNSDDKIGLAYVDTGFYLSTVTVPEPTSFAILALAFGGCAAFVRRRAN